VNRTTFELYTFATVAFLILVAIVFWWVGRGHVINTGPVQMQAQAAPAAGD
jgi:uncharacterized membrane protein YqiK